DWIATLRVEGGEITGLRDRTAELNAALDPEEPFTSIVAFGTDGRGEVYIASIGGSLFRVVPAPETPPSPAFTRGDANSDGGLDISDGVITLIWLFLGSAPPPCLDAADADDSGVVELADAVFTFQYLFLGGAAPPAPGPASCGADPSPDEIDCAQPPPVPGCS
ncbi:MAG: hypothetical protein JXA90_14680, partial [Planctomycetes bacterium]|nr:hypothetical protein [Planctomycetota bacterium]